MDWDVGDGGVREGVGIYHIEARDMMEIYLKIFVMVANKNISSFDIFHIPKKVIGTKIYIRRFESCAP